jgi:hypothetical protein
VVTAFAFIGLENYGGDAKSRTLVLALLKIAFFLKAHWRSLVFSSDDILQLYIFISILN